MRSMMYLMLRQSKNRLLSLKHNPGKLIIYVLAIGFLVWTVIIAMRTQMPEVAGNIDSFKGILAAFFLFSFVVSLIPAFNQGASFFEMEDANFLFIAPIKPRTVLLYGLVKAFKALLFGSWFMVFQIQWMRSSFGVGLGGALVAMFGYILVAIVCQTMTLFIYAFTNSSPRRKKLAKIIILVAFLPAIYIFIHGFITYGNLAEALNNLLASRVADFTPIVGWASAGITHVILGNTFTGLFFMGLLLASWFAFFGAVYFGNPEYYEDVLVATESVFEKTRAAEESTASAVAIISGDKPIKLKNTGINKGIGSSTFFFKHLRESFRSNRFGLWGWLSFFMVAGTVVWSIFTNTASTEGHLLSILATLAVLKMLSAGVGRGMLETYNHFIYLTPESPFSKWIWVNMEGIFKAVVESVVIFVAAGLIVGAPIWTTIAAMVALIMFVFYLMGINLVSMRFTDTLLNTTLLVAVYFAVVIIPLVPGVFLGILLASLLSEVLVVTAIFITVSVWMLLVGIGCFALSKNALHNCDIPVTSPMK